MFVDLSRAPFLTWLRPISSLKWFKLSQHTWAARFIILSTREKGISADDTMVQSKSSIEIVD